MNNQEHNKLSKSSRQIKRAMIIMNVVAISLFIAALIYKFIISK